VSGRSSGKRPFVFVNIAITADGKIAPSNRRFIPFSSRRDQLRMLELRAQADAVLSGARTVDAGEVTLGPGGKKYRQQRLQEGRAEFNLRVIVSGNATLDPKAHIFDHRFSPLILLTSSQAPARRLKRLRFDDVFVSPGATVDFDLAFRWLREKWNVRRLLCEGGGEVNAPLFRQRLVDELHLTIAPVIFGGRTAPTLADGHGLENLADAVPLRLAHRELIGQEIYCIYRAAR
jgi:2,5-diamino-6-(ribosylamino)-4(3H)-pyrimidinone 5'-phosphate reductase